MESYQPEEDYAAIVKAAAFLRHRITELENQLVLYDPQQIANNPLNNFRRDVKKTLKFLPEVNKWMDAMHTDFIDYTRDEVYKMMNECMFKIDDELSKLTCAPPPKPKRIRHYKSKQAYEQAQAEISALAAKVLAPMTAREKWRFVQSRMRIKVARDKTAAVAQ